LEFLPRPSLLGILLLTLLVFFHKGRRILVNQSRGGDNMKKVLICLFLLSFLFIVSSVAQDVYVEGYYRSDGTYVRPHYRSSPDSYKWNNYGRPSYQQRKEWEALPVLLSYRNDYDNDGVWNQYDMDDDNDSLFDDFDNNPYRKDSIYDSDSYSQDDYFYEPDDYYNGESNNYDE